MGIENEEFPPLRQVCQEQVPPMLTIEQYERAKLCFDFMRGVPNEKIKTAPGSYVEGMLIMSVIINQLDTLMKTMHRIASWNEGAEVTSKFDEPESAKIARDVIMTIGAMEIG